MTQLSIRLLEGAVIFLGAFALVLALVVYLLMEISYRREIRRNARRLILSSKLFPALSGEALRALWQRSGRMDREIISDILVEMCRWATNETGGAVERSIMESGIFNHWVRELHKGGLRERVRAATRLSFVHEQRGVSALVQAAEDRAPELRVAVTLSLGRLRDPEGLPGLIRIATEPGTEIPDLTLAAALATCAETCPSYLAGLLQARESHTRVIGAWALSEVADKSVLESLLAASRDSEPEVRAKVARALPRINEPESTEALIRLAGDPVWFVRVRAMDALGRLRASAGEAAMMRGLEDEVREVRYRAAFALRQIQGMDSDLPTKILATGSRLAFDSLISEWEHAGFLWQLAQGLSARDFSRFKRSQTAVKALIAAGVIGALVYLILAFPDIKVRLRLFRLFLEVPSHEVRAQLLALANQPRCDRRVAAAIKREFPIAGAQPVGADRRSSP